MTTITLPAEIKHLYLDEIAELIAFALWPNSEKNYKSALEFLKPELEQAAIEGSLVTKNPLTRQTIPPVMPTDDPLDKLFFTAYIPPPELRIVTVPDLTAYVAARGIAVAMEAPEQSTQPQTAPEQEAVTPAQVVTESASSGTVTVWTPERKKAARAMMDEQRGQGIKAFAANTATAFGVTTTRLRKVLNDKPKKASTKKPKGIWDV